MIMIQQLIQYMVYQINIDLVYDIQFETNITKMDEKLITKQFVKDPPDNVNVKINRTVSRINGAGTHCVSNSLQAAK